MDERTLTYQAFWKLPEKERLERYGALSEHDKFMVRCSMDPGCVTPVCNECQHYRGAATCDAFPDGIPHSVLDLKVAQKNNSAGLKESCNGKDSIHFEPREQG